MVEQLNSNIRKSKFIKDLCNQQYYLSQRHRINKYFKLAYGHIIQFRFINQLNNFYLFIGLLSLIVFTITSFHIVRNITQSMILNISLSNFNDKKALKIITNNKLSQVLLITNNKLSQVLLITNNKLSQVLLHKSFPLQRHIHGYSEVPICFLFALISKFCHNTDFDCESKCRTR